MVRVPGTWTAYGAEAAERLEQAFQAAAASVELVLGGTRSRQSALRRRWGW